MCSLGAMEEMVNSDMAIQLHKSSQRRSKSERKSKKYLVAQVIPHLSPKTMSSGCVAKDAMVNLAEVMN